MDGGTDDDGFIGLRLGRFLDLVASREPAPGGGAVAAMTAAMAASLVAMAARFAPGDVVDAEQIAARSDGHRGEVTELAERDGRAFGQVLAALRSPRDVDPDGRRGALHAAWTEAATVPVLIAETAGRIALDAANIARDGNPNLRGDACTAGFLAVGSARAASTLAELNVRAGKLPPELLDRAAAAVRIAEQAARAAQQAAGTTA